MMKARPSLPLLLALLPLLAAAVGCVGYQMGSSLPRDYKTIAVKTFENRTGEPNLEFIATQAALREFQRDGALSVAEAGSADLVLETTLRAADFEAVRFTKDRTSTANEYRMSVEAVLTLVDRKTKETLIARKKVVGEASFSAIGDSQQARLSAQPKVAEDLAHQIVKNVVEYW